MFGCVHFFNVALRWLGLLTSLRSTRPAKVSNSDFLKSLLCQQQGTLKSQRQSHSAARATGSEGVSHKETARLVVPRTRSALLLPAGGRLLAPRCGVCSACRAPGSSRWHLFPQRSHFPIGTPYLRRGSDKKTKKREKEKLIKGKSVSTLP